MWNLIASWPVVTIVGPGLVLLGFGALSMNPVPIKFALGCLAIGYLVILVRISCWVTFERSEPVWQRGVFVTGTFFATGILWFVSTQFALSRRQPAEQPAPPKVATEATPSLLFVIGSPLGDNQSDKWVMLIQHYGPNRAYSCTIEFVDLDRKNIEHEWLVKHPNTPFLPQGMFDASQASFQISEAGPEPVTASSFPWTPLDPNRQHYLVNISCREGYFVEHWEVTRVDGVLRSRVVIEHGPQWIQNNPDVSSSVFQCQDPEFVSQPLLTEIPKEKHAKVVHPGWRPNYRFEVPVAIIDPNGNIRSLSSVKLPDGSTRTDFGCWNLLTKHFGDAPSR